MLNLGTLSNYNTSTILELILSAVFAWRKDPDLCSLMHNLMYWVFSSNAEKMESSRLSPTVIKSEFNSYQDVLTRHFEK